jgi:hypothetical protein
VDVGVVRGGEVGALEHAVLPPERPVVVHALTIYTKPTNDTKFQMQLFLCIYLIVYRQISNSFCLPTLEKELIQTNIFLLFLSTLLLTWSHRSDSRQAYLPKDQDEDRDCKLGQSQWENNHVLRGLVQIIDDRVRITELGENGV